MSTRTEQARQAARDLSDFVNSFSQVGMEEFVDEIANRTHRSLQQSIMMLIVRLIKRWAVAAAYDDRNEATVKLCKKLADVIKDDDYLPFI